MKTKVPKPFLPSQFVHDDEIEQRDTIVSGQDLEQVILSRAIVRGGVGRKRNTARTTPLTRPPIVVDMPGDTVMMDVGLFGQPNPLIDREKARFAIEQFQTDRAFPPPTYYFSVVGNNDNEPYVFEGPDLTPLVIEPSPEIDYMGFPMQERLASTYNFASAQNQFSAFVPPTPIPGSPVQPPSSEAFILPSPQKAQIPRRMF